MTTERLMTKLNEVEQSIAKYNKALLFIKDLDFVHKSPRQYGSKLEELYQYLDEDVDNEYTDEIMQYMYDYYSGEVSMIPYREFIYLCENFFNSMIKLYTQMQKMISYEINRRMGLRFTDTYHIKDGILYKEYKLRILCDL